jgi:hypothetical protein
MNIAIQIASFVVLLGGSLAFGFLRRPKEMSICVVAGALGLAFLNIDKFASFKGAGFEAVMRDRIEAVVEKETEPVSRDVESGVKMEGYGLVGDEAPKIIKVLLNTNYTWRYVIGISKESGVPIEKVDETLDWLLKNGLAQFSQGTTGRVWTLTRKGRDAFASLNK